MRRRFVLCALALAMFGCDTFERSPIVGRRDYSIDPSVKYERVDLAVLVANPQAGLDVEFDAIFRQRDEVVWAPLFAPFTPEYYASFSVWPANARLWEAAGLIAYVPTLFINKAYSRDFSRYLTLRRYEQVHVKGVVRSTFDNKPWIEVISIQNIGRPLYDEGSLAAFLAGLDDIARKDHPAAIRHLEEALEGALGVPAQVLAHLNLGWLYESRGAAARERGVGDWDLAYDHYSDALGLDPGNEFALQGRGRAERALSHGGIGLVPPEAPAMEAPAAPSVEDSGSMEWKPKYEAEMAARMKAEAAARDAALRAEIAEKGLAKLQADLDDLKKGGGDVTKALAEKLQAAEMEKAKLDQEVKALTAQVEELRKGGDISKALSEKLQAAEADKAKLDQEVKALTAQLDELRKGGDVTKALSEKVQSLEGEKSKLDEQVKALTAESAAKDEQKAKIQTELDDLKKKLEEGGGLAEKVTSLEAEKTKLEDSVKALTAERDELQKKLAEQPAGGDAEALKEQLAAKEAELAAKVTELEELKSLKEMLDSQVKSLRETGDRLAVEKDELQKQNDDLKAQIEELKRQLEEKGE